MVLNMQCATCQLPMQIAPEMSGQALKCPRCGTPFVAMKLESPPPVVLAANSDSFAVTPLADPIRASPLEEAISLLDIFDFSFKRYVTPLIVKTTWVLVCIVTVLWLGAFAIEFVASLIPPPAAAQVPSSPYPNPDLIPQLPDLGTMPRTTMAPRRSSEIRWWISTDHIGWQLITFCTKLFGTMLFLLWMRVALEAIVVVFDSAASLRSIERKIRKNSVP